MEDSRKKMIEVEELTEPEPVSPTGQFFNSSVLSISIIAVMESQVPIDDALTMTLLKDLFLPINPRFSSIMVTDKNGVREWKRVKVNLIDHVNVPVFRSGESPEFYEDQFNNYLSELALRELPPGRPLWEIHIIKYPTKSVAGNLIFKLHHALGDGFSLMGALLSCLKRADNPNLPLTFPNIVSEAKLGSIDRTQGIFTQMGNAVSVLFNTISDFGFGLVKSALVGDGFTPVRSGESGVEFQPIDIFTVTFGLDQVKQIKTNLHVTINDVITGIVFLGTRLYMNETGKKLSSTSTALVLLNTRNIAGYSSVEEMVKPNKNTQWGNQFGFLHVTLPHLTSSKASNPLQFVFEAREIIKRKRSSAAVFLTGKLLELLRKYRGAEVAARYIHGTLSNSSMTVSNLIGPVEQCSLADHPCSGMYFMVVGIPQNLTVTMISYMGQMKIAVGTERNHICSEKFKSCIQTAFDTILKAAVSSVD